MQILVYRDSENDELVPYTIPVVEAKKMGTLSNLMADLGEEFTEPIPIQQGVVKLTIEGMDKILEYFTFYEDMTYDEAKDNVLTEQDKLFFDKLERPLLVNITSASDQLEIPKLLEKTTLYFAETLKDKSVEDIRQILGVENDFSQEEIELLQREHAWANEEETTEGS